MWSPSLKPQPEVNASLLLCPRLQVTNLGLQELVPDPWGLTPVSFFSLTTYFGAYWSIMLSDLDPHISTSFSGVALMLPKPSACLIWLIELWLAKSPTLTRVTLCSYLPGSRSALKLEFFILKPETSRTNQNELVALLPILQFTSSQDHRVLKSELFPVLPCLSCDVELRQFWVFK